MKLSVRWMSARKSRGVTLMELMIGLVIIGIGMTIAVPGFQGMSARNRIATQVNEMQLAINLARGEASRTGAGVSIRAVAPVSDDEFGGGWCVVPTATANCAGSVIRAFPALAGESTLNLIDDGGETSLEFTGLGGVFNDASLSLDLCLAGQQGRRIVISPIGRSKSHKPDDPVEDRRPGC
ncbi:MAG TPA: GspH/FimT family pseudopilin [Pseudomonadales bacterium]|nr:GspH/FimT family pseudopilin [Pseudomonadales bacterium]MDP6316491.1 GspH/FimT family pseudopilin [Pseudomonadales bacterium]MDP7313608.1 GspH/FimT family pseudopilin [Pseudomonadales bacterium]HJP49944.1 GspH/FimT family pseudopilin [Pseudomonadales bacterium]